MPEHESVGSRVAAIRKTRGWTGRELARRASISYSLLAKVESGAAAATPAFIGAVARALRVDVPRITGQPYEEPGSRYAAMQEALTLLRRAVLAHDLPGDFDAEPRPVEDLRRDVDAARSLSRQTRYVQLCQTLPGLITELQAAVSQGTDADRPALYALLAEAYGGVSGLAHQLGHLDLRALVIDRIEQAARHSQDPLRVARTQWSRGATLLGAGAYEQGLVLMERTRSELGDSVGAMSEAGQSVYGSLHLRSAVLAARAGKRPEADAHLTEAREIAGLVTEGANHYGMEYGPANVGVHEVSAAIELADGTLAVSRATQIEKAGHLRTLPPSRAGHYRIEIARGWLYHGDRHRALRALQAARRVSPQLVRIHPMVRDTVYVIARNEPRPSEDLRSFAAWLGLG
jgi:transcriptional regulator with XRE-family HTH domain